VIWRAFPLHPDTPEQGLDLEELFKNKPFDVDKMMEKLKATADKLGLPLGMRKKTFNSRLAQEVGLWAESEGKGHDFHMAAFKAYFVDGENIAQKQVLLKLIESVGLDPQDGEKVMDERTFKDAVDNDWERSRAMGITAVPTFIAGLDRLVGAQPHEVMEKMIQKYTSQKE